MGRSAVIERVKVGELANGPINGPINDVQTQILAILRADSRVSYEDLANKLGKSRNTIKRQIQELKIQEVIKRSGSKKKGYWEVILMKSEV